MVPQGGTATVTAKILPASRANKTKFRVAADTQQSSVTPGTATSANQNLTISSSVTGTSNQVEAYYEEAVGQAATAALHLAVLPTVNKTVAVHAIHRRGPNGQPVKVFLPQGFAAKLQTYLNSIYEQQANVRFTVFRTDHTVDYDILPGGSSGVPDARSDPNAPEMKPIIDAARNTTADINIYCVTDFGHPDNPDAIGFTQEDDSGQCFVLTKGNSLLIPVTAHEIGHTFGLFHPDQEFFDLAQTVRNRFYMPYDDFSTRIMYSILLGDAQKRLVKAEWLAINPPPEEE